MKILRLLRREFVQILLLVLPFVLAGAWWDKIPPQVVTHWGLHGEPNGWMPKAQGLLLLPLLNLGLYALLLALPLLDRSLRRAANAAPVTGRFYRLLGTCRLAITAFFACLASAVVAVAAGWPVNVGRLADSAALVLLAVVGNFLGSVQPNYFVGVRTPWTLGDPATWRATHRLAARVLVFGSVGILAVGFFVPDAVQLVLLLLFVGGLGVWSLGYSAWHFHRQTLR